MIIYKAESRGQANHGWLKSWHTFSFADYYNPGRMNFGALRVLNDDFIAPGMGFGTHPHKDMEIITIPLSGALQHKDSMGNTEIIRKGEVQIMSAGTGIRHSEFNASTEEEVTLLQIWVFPDKDGITPRYEQKDFSLINKKNKLLPIVSPDRREGSVLINQNAYFYLGEIEAGTLVTYKKTSLSQGIYLFVLSGEVLVNNAQLGSRDAAGIDDQDEISIKALSHSEILLMEVPL
jgi:redox-sensitive bicupin YhaK (pirin superfamily)